MENFDGGMCNRFLTILSKVITHSTIKVFHHPTSSECVTAFPFSIYTACPNEHKDALLQFPMRWTGLYTGLEDHHLVQIRVHKVFRQDLNSGYKKCFVNNKKNLRFQGLLKLFTMYPQTIPVHTYMFACDVFIVT